MAYSICFLFNLGNVPGCPREIADICVLGGAPYVASSLQNALLFVPNCTCISNPMTVSY